jgi:hypothetical protein
LKINKRNPKRNPKTFYFFLIKEELNKELFPNTILPLVSVEADNKKGV